MIKKEKFFSKIYQSGDEIKLRPITHPSTNLSRGGNFLEAWVSASSAGQCLKCFPSAS